MEFTLHPITSVVDGLPHFLTVGELGELLRISRAQAYVTARAIGVIHVGRIVRVPAASVRRWLREQEVAQ